MAVDAELVARIKTGDAAALSRLYDSYAAIVYSFAERILRDTAAAESVVQDVFLTVWRKAEQFRPERGSLCTWLLTLTRNKAIDLLRSSSRRESRYVSISSDPGAFEMPGSGPDPLSSAIQKEKRELTLRALTEIPDEQKIPIYLNFYGGLSHQEISERLGVPLGTVKTRIRLGLERLRVTLRQAPR
ncbi:MAG: sigma-70 family RNA polymerase sigma factor [Acidobacteria bacterium]|nr:MAG: sigma-70 family RNA polymerase sigma factor [Acidobacteriota bacterium]